MTTDSIPARDGFRTLAVLIAIEKIEQPSMINLVKTTGIPVRSIDAIIKKANKFGVVIVRKGGKKLGYFALKDPGVYNMDKIPALLKKNFPIIMKNINSASK